MERDVGIPHNRELPSITIVSGNRASITEKVVVILNFYIQKHKIKLDPPVVLSNPRKRPRVQSSSPFVTTMQDDEDAMDSDLEHEEDGESVVVLESTSESTPPSTPFASTMKPDEAIAFVSAAFPQEQKVLVR